MAAESVDAAVNLKFLGLSPKATPQIIETYISAKVEDDDLEVLKVKMLGDGTALAVVKGITDPDDFISQRHKISGKQAEICIVPPSNDPSTNDDDNIDLTSDEESSSLRTDIIPNQIEVTCASGTIDTDLLDMYFSGRKSGGRREKEIQLVEEIEEGIMYQITFESEEDAAAVVAQDKHVCSKKTLSVRYVPAPIPKEYDKDKLIVKDIPTDVDEDLLSTFIEGKLGLDGDEDFEIDFRGTCAIVQFVQERTDEELEAMIKKLTKKKIKKQFLTVERCEVNCCIVISNIKKSFANEDSLEMYFEQKKTGAGEEMVESIEMLGEDSAKVTFVSPAVVAEVLKSGAVHKKKLGPSVTLTVCTPLDSLDQPPPLLDNTSSSSEDSDDSSSNSDDGGAKPSGKNKQPLKHQRPTNSTAKVDKENAKTKKKKKKTKQTQREDVSDEELAEPKQNILHEPVTLPLDPMMAKYLNATPSLIYELSSAVQVNVAVDEKAGNVVLSQNECSPDNWPAIAVEKWEHSLSDLVCKTDIHVPIEGANELYPIIMGNCAKEGLQYAFGKGDNKVCIVGKADVVKKLENDIEELCGRMIKKSEAIRMSEEDYVFLKGVTFQIMQNDHRGVQFKCVDVDHSLSINGSLHDVDVFRQNFSKYTSHSRIPVSLQPIASEFLRNGKGSEVLQSLLQGTIRCVPYFVKEADRQSHTLYLLVMTSDTTGFIVESLVTKICDNVKVETLSLPKRFVSSVANGSKYANFKDNLVLKYPHHSKIQQDDKILIASTVNMIPSVQQAYNHFISEECSTVESVKFKRGAWRLLQTASSLKWTNLTNELKKFDVLIVSSSKPTANRPFVKIKGMPEALALARDKIVALQSSLVECDVPIARPGICNYFFRDPNGQMILKGVETEANVCIEMDVKDDGNSSISSTNGSGPEFVRVCFGNTNEMKTVNVYVGDITEFNRAEVIVNAANENLMHAGGVAQAIEAKGGFQIRQDSEHHVRVRGRVKTGHAVLFPRVGNLPPPYKAIVHAVGPRWEKRNEKEKALLRKAVTQSLTEAKDYHSIAIPAISGGIYGFPPDICALLIMEGIKTFSENERNATLNEINIVVFQNSVEHFVNAAKQKFKNIHCQSDTVSSQPAATVANTPDTSLRLQSGRRALPRGKGSTTPVATANSSGNMPPQPVTPTKNSALSDVGTGKKQFSSSVMKKLKITQGDILKNLENVIINTTDQSFSFNGFVAKALKKGAGPGLEEECEATPTPIPSGEVITTGAHGLNNASYILHIVLPTYNEPNSIKMLSDTILKCLKETDRLGMKSISIPSVGAGNLGYPGNEVAKCLLETAANYLSQNQNTSLNLIHFVIFDKPIYQEFKKHHGELSGSQQGGTSTSSGNYQQQRSNLQPAVFTGSHQSCNFSLPKNLQLEVVQGDITESYVDVIVNTTNPQMRLVGRGVAGALAKKAGPGLQSACDRLARQGIKLDEGNVVDTPCANMGSLQCKSIFHIVFESRDQSKLEQTVYACLERAEKMGYSSIAFPAIGTGVTNIPPQIAVNAIVNALRKFTSKKNPKCLSIIRMVLFQQQHYTQFVDAFKKMESNSGGFLRKMINTVGSYLGFGDEEVPPNVEGNPLDGDDENRERMEEWEDVEEDQINILANLSRDAEVIVTIYGEDQPSVGRAEKKLRAIIDTQFIDEEINHENVSFLSSSSVSMLKEFASKHQVDIDIDRDPALHYISLHGCSSDVLIVKDKVRDVLASFNQDKVMKEAAEAMSKHIRWVQVFTDDDTNEYGRVATFEIERAYQRKAQKYVSTDPNERFEIDFTTMEERDLSSGDVVKVRRVDLLQEEKPTNWDPMPCDSTGKEVEAHYVTLQPGSSEYSENEQKFHVTMRKGTDYKMIISIQRIQNPILYGQYVARKREMDKRNPPNCTNERWLFHGTAPEVVNAITTQGFNRSFQGKNAVVYGQGAYFARDATYSNRDTYSVPDANGVKHMYIARVLTGEYTLGNSSMIVPPPKNPNVNKHVLFDSTVDNQASPGIYVVYGDSQSYPAYLIKYKKK